MNFKTILIISSLVSLLLASYFFSQWYQEKQNSIRLSNNFTVLADEMEQIDFKHIQLLELTKQELKKSFPELEEKIKQELNIKLKNVQMVSNTVTTINHTFKTIVKDSLRLDSISVQKISFKDAWLDFEAEKAGEEFFVNRNIQTVPLLQVIHRDKWKFKYLFRKRPLLQDIKSDNPYADITFSRVIEVSK